MLAHVCASEISPISHYFTCRGHFPQLWPAPIKATIWVCSRRVMLMCSAEYIVLCLAPSPEMSMHAPGKENVAPNDISCAPRWFLTFCCVHRCRNTQPTWKRHTNNFQLDKMTMCHDWSGDTCWKCCIEGRNGSAQEGTWHHTFIFLPICLIVVEQQFTIFAVPVSMTVEKFCGTLFLSMLGCSQKFRIFFALHFSRNFAESSHLHCLVAG